MTTSSRGVCRNPPPGWYCTRGHGHEGPCNGRPLDPTGPVWYMRDNHTFRPLSGNPEQMVAQALEDFDAGWSSGMLCSNARQISVHGRGSARRAEFEREALAALRFVALAAEEPKPVTEPNEEPWNGHEYQEVSMGVWRCRKGCGPTLYSHLAPDSVKKASLPEEFTLVECLAVAVAAVTRLWPTHPARGRLGIDLPSDLSTSSLSAEFSERESSEERWAVLQLRGDEVSVLRGGSRPGDPLRRLVYRSDKTVVTQFAEPAAAIIDHLAGAPRE